MTYTLKLRHLSQSLLSKRIILQHLNLPIFTHFQSLTFIFQILLELSILDFKIH